MELVASLFAATATAAAAAAPAAATAVSAAGATAGAVSAAAGASSVLSILQGVATAGSAVLGLASGISQSMQEDLAAKAEANRIKREELIKIGQLRVAFAGSGVDVTTGQALSLESDIQKQAKFEIGLAKATGQMRSTAALIKGAGNALYLGGGGLIDIARRG